MKIYVLPSSGKIISGAGLNRLIKTINSDLCNSYVKVKDFEDINKQICEIPWYGVFYDNEYLDPRLSNSIKHFLIYSRGIDMLTLYLYTKGSQHIHFEPRIFLSPLMLDSNNKKQPLPRNAEILKFEKILNGWIYRD